MIVVRAIKTGKPFQSSIFRDEVNTAAKEIQKDMLDDFKRTTKTWKHKPAFSTKVDYGVAVGGVRIQVATDDPIYGYVDLGTKPHIIKPKKKGYPLKFQTGGQPKTEPEVILSVPGKVGNNTARAMIVHHPGTKARKFTKVIANSYKPEFSRRIKNALGRFARRSGHATK